MKKMHLFVFIWCSKLQQNQDVKLEHIYKKMVRRKKDEKINNQVNNFFLNFSKNWNNQIIRQQILLKESIMSKKTKSPQKSQIPKKNFLFYLGSRQRHIKISCDFDSGNIEVVRQLSEFHYRLQSVLDGTRTKNKVNSKSWFHFSVQGFPKNTKGKFIVSKVQTLASVYYQTQQSKYNKSYRPVYRVEGQEWKRLQTETQLVLRQSGELQCVFQYLFASEQEKVYFAFCYPYSYRTYLNYINDLNDCFYQDEFYFYKEILTRSPEQRDVHLITITSHDHKDKENQFEEHFDKLLFPQEKRPLKFNKPVVLISARVHPGQTPPSFAMEGIINFLTDKKDLRAHLLRKMFVFMIVPMINVDGVYHGHFRMDIYGKNLNRFYLNPDPQLQPAVYAIKELANHLCKQNRLSFYFDLHAHNAKKGCFIYGNAINDFVQQVESQVFCKLFAMNHKGFEYDYCNFSQKHMNAKDTNDEITKEGCGRVVMYRLANIIHSYSLECGIISTNKLNIIPDPTNSEFEINGKGLIQDPYEDNKDPIYQGKTEEGPLFIQQMYRNLGKNLLVSILDVFDKNPYNRIYNSQYKSMDMLRRVTAFQIFHNTERFRMFQRFVFGKVKNINELIKEVLKQKINYKQLYNFYVYEDKELKDVSWPQNIAGLLKPVSKVSIPSKLRKFRSFYEPRKQYEYEFFQILQKNKVQNSTEIQQGEEKDQEKQLKNNQNSSCHSSQTDDFSPCKKYSHQFNEQEFLASEIESKRQNYMHFTDRNFSNALLSKQTREDQFASVRLHQTQKHDKRPKSPQKFETSESPSVRVRRILKQQNRGLFSSKQVRQSEEEEQFAQLNLFNKDSLIESIKEDIKMELRRQQQKKLLEIKSNQTHLFHMGHFGEKLKLDSKQTARIRSTSVRNQTTKFSGSKIQLPSLGARFFIVSNSNKTINKKK